MENIAWDDCYLRDETPWDKGGAAPPLADYLENGVIEGRVLVPGCGRGHDVRALAGKGAEVIGFDISPTAIEAAEAVVRAGDERYLVGDLFDPPASFSGMFDFVFEHTCVSALPPEMRDSYGEQMSRCLKPGGKFFGIFYINPWEEGEEPTPPPWGITRDEIEAMFAGRLELVQEWVPARTYPGREGRELVCLFAKTP